MARTDGFSLQLGVLNPKFEIQALSSGSTAIPKPAPYKPPALSPLPSTPPYGAPGEFRPVGMSLNTLVLPQSGGKISFYGK